MLPVASSPPTALEEATTPVSPSSSVIRSGSRNNNSRHHPYTTVVTTTTHLQQQQDHTAGDHDHPDHDQDVDLYHHHHPNDRFWIRLWSSISFALALCVLVLSVYVHREHSVGMTYTSSPPPASVPSTLPSKNEIFPPASILPWRPLPSAETVLHKIAFGSCSSQSMPQPYWDVLVDEQQMMLPDLLLLMGDNVYGDCVPLNNDTTTATTTTSTSQLLYQACAPLIQAYQDMAAHASVRGAASRLAVFATLDDHDYGIGDADRYNPYQDVARAAFTAFFGLQNEQFHSPDGVYRSRIWGTYPNRLQVILLDTRAGRSPFRATGDSQSPYQPYDDDDNTTNNSGTDTLQLLSPRQWEWLQGELAQPAELRLLVSSIQVLNDGTGFECWRHIPAERQRLISLIRRKSVILLSGDRHVGGFYQYRSSSSSSTTQQDDNNNNTTQVQEDTAWIREVTASSWTHTIPLGTFGDTTDEIDPRRIGDLVRVNHFGTVEIDWSRRNVTVSLRRAQSSDGVPYSIHASTKTSDAGHVIQQTSWLFPF